MNLYEQITALKQERDKAREHAKKANEEADRLVEELSQLSRLLVEALALKPRGRPRGTYKTPVAGTNRYAVLEFVNKNGRTTNGQVVKKFGLGRAYASLILTKLAHAGLIGRVCAGVWEPLAPPEPSNGEARS